MFTNELLAWNQKTNLTAITEPHEVAEKHILDSLIPATHLQALDSSAPSVGPTMLDIGSGGGFPGIPLKILQPHLHVTLVDSVRKKVTFLKYVIRTLKLDGIDAVHARVEDLAGREDFAGQFDVVISRAFTALDRFVALALPFVKPDGMIIAMKGKEVQSELDAMAEKAVSPNIYQFGDDLLKCKIDHYSLPDSGSRRSLVILRKLH